MKLNGRELQRILGDSTQGNKTIKMLQSLESGTVNVLDFRAKADAKYIDVVGKTGAYKDAAFTQPATDNSDAFEEAFDFCMKACESLLYRSGSTNSGWRSNRFEIKIPSGSFLITRAQIFALRNLGLTGTQSGITIRGNGVNNTNLVYHNLSEEDDAYLFYDNNHLPGMSFRDLSIKCCTGKEKLFYVTSEGNSQNHSYRDVAIRNYYRGWGFYGTGNADKTVFDKCDAISTVPGNIMYEVNNSQSIGHTFRGCNFLVGGSGSIMFNTLSGGLNSIFGGSYIVQTGATMYRVHSTGGSIGSTNISYSCFATKTEIHDDSVYIDINAGTVTVNSEKNRFLDNDTDNLKVKVRGAGLVIFNNVQFQDAPRMGLESDNDTYAKDTKPTILFNNCILQPNYTSTKIGYYSNIDSETNFIGTHANIAGIGRVHVDGAPTNSSSNVVNFNDGSPYAYLGHSSRSQKIRVARARANALSGGGLPNLAGSVTITLPLNCEIRKIAIVKQGGYPAGAQAVQIWKIKDGDNVDLVTLTTASQGEETISEINVRRKINTTAKRSYTLYSHQGDGVIDLGNSNHYAEGYMEIEYI